MPTPQSITRVFVGRVEVLSLRTERTIEAALTSGDVNGIAQKFGRFLQPFFAQIRREKSFPLSAAITGQVETAAWNISHVGSCVQ